MFRTLFLLATVLVAAFAAPAPNDDGDVEWMRIVGGSNALAGEAPYMVSIRTTGNFHFCGGSILNSHTVITAASCLTGHTPATTILVAGTNVLNSGGFRYPVARFIPHPSYDPTLVSNDIALVITNNWINYSTTIARVGLSHDTLLGAGISAKLTGWGTNTYPSGSLINSLQSITLKTISVEQCRSSLAAIGNIYATQICTLNSVGQGMCQGDSGSPLVERGLVIGVASWGSPCAVGLPDVFTRVASYASWITINAQN